MKHLLLALGLCLSVLLCSAQVVQGYDYSIDMTYYRAFYSSSIKTSSFVVYKLYNPSKNVSRENLSFKKYKKLPHFNYSKSGYDIGHLMPAADAADSLSKMKATFYFINAVPQTKQLNRGVWQQYEADIRELSKRDSLIIVVGGCDYSPRTHYIPDNCFKIVYSLSTGKCIYTLIFDNSTHPRAKVSKAIQKMFPYSKVKLLYDSSRGTDILNKMKYK